MRRITLFALFVATVFVVAAVIMVVRAILLTTAATPEQRTEIFIDADRVARNLSGAIRFQTVSGTDKGLAEFLGLHNYLAATYPLVHARIGRKTVNGASLLYEWKGRDRTEAPVVLMGHLDVVAVAPETENSWTKPPYSGAISDGFVYGRGAMDDKSAVIVILEAVEQLLQEGFRPKRTIYLAFGSDEEVGGTNGAREILRLLQARQVGEPAIVLDEGGALFEAQMLGVDGLAAMIGIAEKGYLSLELSIEGPGGHSSTPLVPTQIGRLSAAIARLEADQFPARLEDPTLEMFRSIAPRQPFAQRLILTNLWLFGPLVTRQLLSSPETATLVKTTTAPTIFNAGETENVLPAKARAVVNFQILTSETVDSVVARVKAVIADDGVNVQRATDSPIVSNPSPVSDVSGPAFAALTKAVRQTLGEAPPLTVPYLSGPTDSRYWAEAGARNVFRFTPFLYEEDWMKRVHGTDERISVKTLADGVKFYRQLILNADDLQDNRPHL